MTHREAIRKLVDDPAEQAFRTLLALKLISKERKSHVMGVRSGCLSPVTVSGASFAAP